MVIQDWSFENQVSHNKSFYILPLMLDNEFTAQ